MQPFHKVLAQAIGQNIGSLLNYPNGDFGRVARRIIEGTEQYYECGGERLLLDDSKPWTAFHVFRGMTPNTRAPKFSCTGFDADSEMSFVLFGYLDNIEQDNAWTCISAFDRDDVIYKGSSTENTFTGYAAFRRVTDNPVEIARKYGLQVDKVERRQTEIVALEIEYILTLKDAKKKGELLTFVLDDGSSLTPSFPSTCCPQNNLNADRLPTVNDDYSEGYRIGSEWVYNGNVYYLTDATTGAAVWENMTFTVSDADLLYAPIVHNHDDRYYTETESDATFAPIAHTHSNYLESVQSGTNITIDNTDPQNPIINASGGGGTPAGSDNNIQFNDGGSFGANNDFRFYDTAPFWGTRLDIRDGDININNGALSLKGNPSVFSEFGYGKIFMETFPVDNMKVAFGSTTKTVKFISPTYDFITSSPTFHGSNDAGVTYLIDSATPVTVQLDSFSGSNTLEIEYYVVGAGSLTLTQSSGTIIGAKTVFATGEGCRVQYIPFDLGSSYDANWMIYA